MNIILPLPPVTYTNDKYKCIHTFHFYKTSQDFWKQRSKYILL